MYKSPIDVLQKQIRLQYENDILKAVQEYSITVDKEELLKALQYDREQYEKGFADGTRAIARVLERLEEEKTYKSITHRRGNIYRTRFVNNIDIDKVIEIIKEEVE